jgi:hypothetical protein
VRHPPGRDRPPQGLGNRILTHYLGEFSGTPFPVQHFAGHIASRLEREQFAALRRVKATKSLVIFGTAFLARLTQQSSLSHPIHDSGFQGLHLGRFIILLVVVT